MNPVDTSAAPTAKSLPVLALMRDLLFSSKIVGAGKAAGTPVVVVRDPATLAGRIGRRVFVDLTLDGAIEAAVAWHKETACDVVGFAGHVNTEVIAQAKSAGIPRVMSNGQFVQMLPELVR
jgi:hypothetical protein